MKKPNSRKYLIVITGPTAIGKTALSISLAKTFSCPVLSADSRQFFREMCVGTAKPSEEEMEGIPHYFIDSHSIKEEFNVGRFETEAISILEKLFEKQNIIVMAGGSGLYVDAVCKGFDALPDADPAIRKEIADLLEKDGISALRKKLLALDPDYCEYADMNNPQRLSRALEVCLSTGKPYSNLRAGKTKQRNFHSIKIGLNTRREKLYERINKRVDQMMQAGLLEEVKTLLPYRHSNALQTVGYKELFDYLDGLITLERAVELIRQNTRRFAKRQLTWFRRDEEIKWFEPEESDKIIEYIQSIVSEKN